VNNAEPAERADARISMSDIEALVKYQPAHNWPSGKPFQWRFGGADANWHKRTKC